MGISEQIVRIQTDRNTIRTKLIALKLSTKGSEGVEPVAITATSNLDDCASAVDAIVNNGSVSATVKEGETYTIPKGYHDGTGTVSGIKGGGNYTLQSKTVTPTKDKQEVTCDQGYYGISDVTVNPIPDAYQDVTSVTATADDVLATKTIVDKTGAVIAGAMVNNGSVEQTIDIVTPSYTIPKGYHDGTGTVSLDAETKSATPTKKAQTVEASTGKVLSAVTVAAIPDEFQDVTAVTATADKVLTGSDFVDAAGNVVSGTMANNGAIEQVLDVKTTSYTVPVGYHNGEGAVSIALEDKSVTPTKAEQTVTPANGKVLSSVTVAAIPEAYQDVTGVTAAAGDVLVGKKFVDADGTVVTGTMANLGDITATIDGLTQTSVTIAAGYTTGGTISLTDDIENQLAAI